MKGAEMNETIGKKAQDAVTGFTGTIIAFAQYLTGCDQYLVLPECEEGKTNAYPEGKWFDVNRLNEIESEKKTVSTEEDKGPCGVAPLY